MSQTGLHLEQAPPISVPFRFFLSAPIFLVLASAVLLWRGPEVFESRLSGAAFAVTHLFTLGFMSMVMMGALMQLLPVVAGAPIARPRTVAAITHTGLCIGTLSLAAGFLCGASWLIQIGTAALGIGFAVFIAAAGASLWRAPVKTGTTLAIRLAVLALAVTVIFGLMLASSFGWGIALPGSSIPDLHPAWGLAGWLGLLAIGVAYQVVPMFQMTPRYPAAMMKYFAAAVFVLLALWSAVLWNASETWGRGAGVLALGAAYIAFAATTLILQRQRRRRQSDVTLDFWKTGMACLIAACAAWALCLAAPEEHRNAVEVLAGLLALPGFAGSIISGMLYKIVPFLAWFHLQSRPGARGSVPNMKEMLGEPRQRLQFRIHMAALALLVAAVAWPGVLAYPAALALGASAILLEVNLLKVVGVLRRTRNARNALPAARR